MGFLNQKIKKFVFITGIIFILFFSPNRATAATGCNLAGFNQTNFWGTSWDDCTPPLESGCPGPNCQNRGIKLYKIVGGNQYLLNDYGYQTGWSPGWNLSFPSSVKDGAIYRLRVLSYRGPGWYCTDIDVICGEFNYQFAASSPTPTPSITPTITPFFTPTPTIKVQSNAGVVFYQSSSVDLGQAQFSGNNWAGSYSYQSFFTPALFADYVKSRKENLPVENFGGFSSIFSNDVHIYTYNQSLTIDSTVEKSILDMVNKSIIIIVRGDVFITGTADKFNPQKKSIAILAFGNININSAIKELNGIFIGNNFDFASDINLPASTPNELKITGNIISQTEIPLNIIRKRNRINNSFPSIFIVFSPKMYFDLLPYLSIATYDWQQLK